MNGWERLSGKRLLCHWIKGKVREQAFWMIGLSIWLDLTTGCKKPAGIPHRMFLMKRWKHFYTSSKCNSKWQLFQASLVHAKERQQWFYALYHPLPFSEYARAVNSQIVIINPTCSLYWYRTSSTCVRYRESQNHLDSSTCSFSLVFHQLQFCWI